MSMSGYVVGSPLEALPFLKGMEIQHLTAAGISTFGALLEHFPKRYEDRRRFDVFPTQAGEKAVCLRGVVTDMGRRFMGGRKSMLEAVVCAQTEMALGSNTITCRWFNALYIQNIIAAGQELVLYGKVKESNGRLVIDHPEFEIIDEGAEDESIHVERIVPIYKNIAGISQRRLREILFFAVSEIGEETFVGCLVVDPSYPRTEASAEIHFPETMEQAEAAERYFALEEFVKLQLAVARRRLNYAAAAGVTQGRKMRWLKQFYESLPFDLTGAQKRCVREIIADMRAPQPMQRLLQGDVGSGKTFVALCAAILAAESGNQVALMAPTQILAEQHFRTFSKWLEPFDLDIRLLTGDKKNQGAEAEGYADILIGTHALLYARESFSHLGLVIIDEQHKFGVEQRQKLIVGDAAPDVLVMTATPIPRTLTLTIYGDLEVSVIDEYPSGRGKLVSGLRPNAKVSDVSQFLKQHLSDGRQAYIVYPLIEESDSLRSGAATVEFEKWQKRLKPHQVGLLHGAMSREEKEATMSAFRDREIAALISTSVVEVGVDVPNANVMVIYDAERFGLSQLHQLRGRVGRGEHKSYCILITRSKKPESLEKLEVLASTSDGFKIAEQDLRLRGPGNLLGTEQSGLSEMRFVQYLSDPDLVRESRAIAKSLIEKERKEAH